MFYISKKIDKSKKITAFKKAEIGADIGRLLAKINNEVIASEIIDQTSKALEMDKSTLNNLLSGEKERELKRVQLQEERLRNKQQGNFQRNGNNNIGGQVSSQNPNYNQSQNHQTRAIVYDKKERELNEFLCLHPQFIKNASGILFPEDFVDQQAASIYKKLMELKEIENINFF